MRYARVKKKVKVVIRVRTEKILVVDKDPELRRQIWKCLQPTGILIYQSDSVEKTLDIMTRVDFQLFLIDSELEYEKDGFHLVQMIREHDTVTPIIFFASAENQAEIVFGLESGADYFLTKPFVPDILKAQILATLERMTLRGEIKPEIKKPEVTLGDFRIDHRSYLIYQNEKPLKLSAKEMQLLRFFLENPNQVFTKEEIYYHVWEGKTVDNNTLTVFIRHLRTKIEKDPHQPRYLKTTWGIGYLFSPEGDALEQTF